MTYAVRLTSPAQRDLNRLPENVLVAVVEFIYGPLPENPQRVAKALRHELAGHHGARRGAYRVIYVIKQQEVFIEVITIDHRRDIYRRR